MKTWFIDFPTYKYVENVKELAREHGLSIVDAKFQGEQKQCLNAPSLSLKEEYRPKTKTVARTKAKK